MKIDSLFVYHTLRATSPAGQVMLNSACETLQNNRNVYDEMINKNGGKTKKVETTSEYAKIHNYEPWSARMTDNYPLRTSRISFEREGTKVRVEREIFHLDSLTQDVFEFKERFEMVSKEVKWSDEVAKDQLMALLSYNIIATLNNHDSSDRILNEILKRKYDTRLEELYETKLSQVKQINFRYIKQYQEEIEQLAKRLIICAEPAIKDTSKIIDRQFIRGLHPDVRMHSFTNGTTTAEEIYDNISMAEPYIKTRYDHPHRKSNFENKEINKNKREGVSNHFNGYERDNHKYSAAKSD